ncbi:hypothetical protein NMG60_11037270 [Bertholletia excelsa]
MMELEARRERVKLNVALLKKEEEEKRAREDSSRTAISTGKVGGPDLKSFIQQFPAASEGKRVGDAYEGTDATRKSEETATDKKARLQPKQVPESSEPTGSGESFRPGTWQPPT